MAGEIKLNDVSIATESGGTVTLGNATLGSTVVLGTNASPIASNLVLAAGNGIDFSAASGSAAGSSSAVLDDYEEGAFTPQWYGVSTAGTVRNGNLGRYTKIGQTVHVEISFDGVAEPTGGSGNLIVSGLPFALKSSGPYNYPLALFILLGGGSALTPRMVSFREASSTTFNVQYAAGSMNQDVINIIVSDLGSSNYLRASFSYTTNS
jgi:hypothetical protein